ncbi:MAG: ribonuclease H-like domain-containing protein [Caldimicrobium sp.]
MNERLKLLEYYLENEEKALFLDIETEGLSKERNDITVIGIYKENRYCAFVRGYNFEKVISHLVQAPIWITFGGENFDLPFIKKTFINVSLPKYHIDLYHYTSLLGLRGGLKKIEKMLGLERKTDGMTGYDAVKLWKKWQEERDRSALRKLLLYNREDVVNLKSILNFIIEKVFYERQPLNLIEGREKR